MRLLTRGTTRRSFVAMLGVALAGCAAPAPAAPTAAPASAAKPAAPPPTPVVNATVSAAAPKPAEVTGAAATGASIKADYDRAMDALYQAAKASGQMKVVHYGPGSEYASAIELFKARFPGTEVEPVLLRGPEMIQRINAEAASGKPVATAASTGETTMSELERLGRLAQWDLVHKERLPKPELPSDNYRFMFTVGVFGVVINTNLVPADKIPKGRQDLLDPFWNGKGKLYTEDPRAAGPGQSFWVIAHDAMGPDYLKKLREQGMSFTRDRDAAPSQVARGEYPIYFPTQVNDEVQALTRSSPLKLVFFSDPGGTHFDNTTYGVVKEGTAQDVSKLYLTWLTSDEGQRALAEKVRVFPVVEGAPGPAGLPSFAEIKPVGRTADQRQRNNEYIKKLDEIFFG